MFYYGAVLVFLNAMVLNSVSFYNFFNGDNWSGKNSSTLKNLIGPVSQLNTPKSEVHVYHHVKFDNPPKAEKDSSNSLYHKLLYNLIKYAIYQPQNAKPATEKQTSNVQINLNFSEPTMRAIRDSGYLSTPDPSYYKSVLDTLMMLLNKYMVHGQNKTNDEEFEQPQGSLVSGSDGPSQWDYQGGESQWNNDIGNNNNQYYGNYNPMLRSSFKSGPQKKRAESLTQINAYDEVNPTVEEFNRNLAALNRRSSNKDFNLKDEKSSRRTLPKHDRNKETARKNLNSKEEHTTVA